MQKVRLRLAGSLLFVLILIGCPPSAHADAAIPMMPVRYPLNLAYLIPVVLIEALYLKQALDAQWRRTLLAVTGVNCVTMALGYPLAYGIYMAANSAFQFPDGMNDVFWHVGSLPLWLSTRLFSGLNGMQQGVVPVVLTFILLLVPGFLLSGLVKAWLMEWYDLMSHKGETRAAVWLANRLSYLFLIVAGSVVLYLNYSGT